MAQASRGAQGIEFFTHVENGKRNAKLIAFRAAVDRQISNNVDLAEHGCSPNFWSHVDTGEHFLCERFAIVR